jgi:hypothetical protein
MVEMIIKGNTMKRHAVAAGVPQSSPTSLILFGIYTSGLIKCVKEHISAEGLSFEGNLS